MRTFQRSIELHERAGGHVAGSVNSHFRLGVRPQPLVIDHADGAYVIDVDGNRYVDYYLGMGPVILGHTPPDVIDAVHRQLTRGVLFAAQTELEFEAAALVCRMVPSAESVRFGSSGSEVIQAALRTARAATGRNVVVKFEGHYHGWLDNIYWSVSPQLDDAGPARAPRGVPHSAGQCATGSEDLVVLPWNDLPTLARRLSDGDVAAVIMEPVMFNSGGILPSAAFLQGVREACDRSGTVLIFDEVITGFRVGPGGAQEHYNVTPDLTTLGKAIANGFPVAALAGRRDLMSLIGSGRVVHGGTYNAQAAGMAATIATLTRLAEGSAYAEIAKTGTRLMDGLRSVFEAACQPATVTGFPGVFQVRFGDATIHDYRGLLRAGLAAYQDFAAELILHGVRALGRGTWFVSAAHDEASVDLTLEAVAAALAAEAERGR